MNSLSRKILRRIGDNPARLAFAVSNIPAVRRRMAHSYEASLARHRPALPVLHGIDRDIVDGLERDGMFITSLDALGITGSADMLRTASRIGQDCTDFARHAAGAGQEFIVAPASAMVDNPILFRWGLDARMMDIAEAYIGLPVAYDGMQLIYTVADGTELGARKWHRDREDRKMIKVAVYCTDVTNRGGPFELISRVDPSQGRDDRYEYEFGTADVLNRRLGPDYADAVVSCTGPAGTVVFADTARYFHRGAPAYDKDRTALYYGYFAVSTRHPYFCERSGLSRREIADLVKDMSPRQRAAARWQAALPPLLRLIPPAPV